MFQNATIALSVSTLAAITLPVVLVLVLMVCLSCLKRKTASGFSNFSNSAESTNTSSAHVNNTFTIDVEDTNVDGGNSTAISLEPLPDITSKLKLPTCPLRPQMGRVDVKSSDGSLKQIVAHQPFPRNQITYLKELGSGWFGKVIESDAESITAGAERTKVVVKMLKDDASKDEQQLFLDEVAVFRELEDPKLMRLLGQCTEINPMLLIVEYAAFGNLKQYLRNHRHEQATLIQKNRLIQFALEASSGLACLHKHDILHKDLAARNCLVMSDHTVKVGDYGIAEDLFKEDYLSAGDELLPIRWMAPETLKQENRKWTSAEFSKATDIWALGVLLWEIAMLGERPYDMLTDEAVLQGVITDKDIRLPKPDIGMPNIDRLYEVMRFCWMDPSDRLKVDEVYKLLEQIASKMSENSTSGDAITAFEQKWEHLMPNQRHTSVDSVDDQQESLSSDDSNLLNSSLSDPNSLEDLTSAETGPGNPSAPPRASRRKLSVRAVTIPKVDDDSEEVPAASKPQAKERAAVPKISVIDETGQQTEVTEQQEESEKPQKAEEPKSSEMEFTEFTSHSTDEEAGEETPNVSQIVSGAVSPDKTLPENEVMGSGDTGVASQADASSKAVEGVADENFNTPDRSQAKARKTSTPLPQADPSPSSSSSLSGGDSSATFVTARSSSPGNLTDAYATASDSTLVTGKSQMNFTTSPEVSGEASGESSVSFEILDSTAVPSVPQDSGQSKKESHDSEVSDPFSSTSFNQNPFTGNSGAKPKDDAFGEFTNGSFLQEDGLMSQNNSAVSSASTTLPLKMDTSVTQQECYSITDESQEAVSKSPQKGTFAESAGPSVPQEADPFASLGTDLSSLSSLVVPKPAESLDQEQAFPTFSSEFSSLSSFSTESTVTPQAEPQSDIFAFEKPSQVQEVENNGVQATEKESQKELSSLEDFASDLLSPFPGAASSSSPGKTEEQNAKDVPEKESDQLAANLQADFNSIPLDSSSTGNPFVPDSGSHSKQPAADLFGVGEPEPSMQDSSFEILHSQGEKSSLSSSAFSDFDMLGSFTSAPGPSASPTNPFAGGDLLQELAGSSSSALPAETQKESQDGLLTANSSTDPNKPSEAALVDFSAFESSTTDASKQDEVDAEKAASEANTTASLIDF